MSSVSVSRGSLVPGERREVAILFMDLHGFTTLSEDLDHETVHRLNTGIMRALSRTVQANGGYIDKYEGDRLMALFGAVRAHSDDCVRAVSAGIRLLEIVREIGGILVSRNISIGARVGIAYGPVTVAPDPSGHLTASGDFVNIASRMESGAEVGTVQATESVMKRCGDIFKWTDLGERKVRGRRMPVHSYRPEGPGKDRIGEGEGTPAFEWDFVDRTDELRRLREVLGRPSSSALLRGHDGSGKTRTAMEMAKKELGLDQAAVLFTDNTPYAREPFQMWTSALKYADAPLHELAPAGERRDCLSDLLGGSAWSGGGDMSPESLRELRISVLISAVQAIGRLRKDGVLLVADDLHLADSGSLEVLERIAGSGGIRILASTVPGDSEGYCPGGVLRDMMEVVEIPPMDREATVDLVRSMLSARGGSIADELLEALGGRLHHRSAGIPFITAETVKLLLERGILTCSAGRWEMQTRDWEDTVPESVRGLLRCRIDTLSSRERKLLQMASVMGHSFDIGILEDAAAILAPEISVRISRLAGALAAEGILIRPEGVPEGILEFVNPLFGEIASSTLLRQNRISIHRTVASCMEDRYGMAPGRFSGEIALHRMKAGDLDEALKAGIAALDYMTDTYQNDEMLSFSFELERWLEGLADGEREDIEMLLLLKRQKVQYRMGLFGDMESTLKRQMALASARGMDGELGKTYCSLGELRRMQGDFQGARELLGRSIDHSRKAGDLSTLGMSLSNLGALLHGRGDSESSEQCFREAISVQEQCGNRRSAGIAMMNLAAVLREKDRPGESRELLERAMVNFHRTSYRMGEATALVNLALLREADGEAGEALDLVRRAVSINRETGFRIGLAGSLTLLAKYLTESDPDQALKAVSEALTVSETAGHFGTRFFAVLEKAGVMAALRRVGEAVEDFRSAVILLGSRKEAPTPEMMDRLEDTRRRLEEAGACGEDLPKLPDNA